MNPELKRHALLDDVLAEAAPAEFERDLLNRTLGAVRRRRRSRQLARGLGVVGAFAGMVLVLWNAPGPFNPLKSVRPALNLVSSQPLLPAMIVRAKPHHVAGVH